MFTLYLKIRKQNKMNTVIHFRIKNSKKIKNKIEIEINSGVKNKDSFFSFFDSGNFIMDINSKITFL